MRFTIAKDFIDYDHKNTAYKKDDEMGKQSFFLFYPSLGIFQHLVVLQIYFRLIFISGKHPNKYL